ncbi:hypothetical protein J6590_091142 [Homalodisca vitripennis]|nr:hypothetical protein J6590_091142 [Homalodisca vitripennis]
MFQVREYKYQKAIRKREDVVTVYSYEDNRTDLNMELPEHKAYYRGSAASLLLQHCLTSMAIVYKPSLVYSYEDNRTDLNMELPEHKAYYRGSAASLLLGLFSGTILIFFVKRAMAKRRVSRGRGVWYKMSQYTEKNAFIFGCLFKRFLSEETETIESDSYDPEHEAEKTWPTHSEAYVAAETLMSWLEKQNDSSPISLIVFK